MRLLPSYSLLVITVLLFTLGNFKDGRAQLLHSQQEFTKADTLRGSITPERAWWEVTYYDLHVNVSPTDSSLQGFNRIHYKVVKEPRKMQIDLQQPLKVDRFEQDGEELSYSRKGNAFFVDVPDDLKPGSEHILTVYYQGKPKVAQQPPWDGGLIWRQDDQGNHWIATANQGLGASVWWPNKDHQSAEPDSMQIAITVPSELVNVSNGRLRSTTDHDNGRTTYTWFVQNPINNYNVAINAGNYTSFSDTLHGADGVLDLNYWVLEQHLDQAKKQFVQVKPMMRCFENWFGPYPFYEDSFKLIETPHLGMEHQSAVAYGNQFTNGYMGTDLSGTGWGLLWDFIIIHESGHEWFGNNITTNDIADMWVHEGFTNYSEAIYTECIYGKQAGAEYVIGLRDRIQNSRPITGEYGVNHEGSGDMYYKGSNMIHTIRQIVDNDSLWRSILRDMNETFRHQTVTAQQIQDYIIDQSGKDLTKLFEQYLHHTEIPTLEYYLSDSQLYYRWTTVVDEFNMPIKVTLQDQGFQFITPTTQWQTTKHDLSQLDHLRIDQNFYVRSKQRNTAPEL